MPQPIILEDTFVVSAINADGRVYQRVSRIECKNLSGTLQISSDINVEEFPIEERSHLTIALASTLNIDGLREKEYYDHSIYHRDTLLNKFDYAMHGKVYEYVVEEKKGDGGSVEVFISFGGLLTKVEGSVESLKGVRFNDDIFLLIKKVASK